MPGAVPAHEGIESEVSGDQGPDVWILCLSLGPGISGTKSGPNLVCIIALASDSQLFDCSL